MKADTIFGWIFCAASWYFGSAGAIEISCATLVIAAVYFKSSDIRKEIEALNNGTRPIMGNDTKWLISTIAGIATVVIVLVGFVYVVTEVLWQG